MCIYNINICAVDLASFIFSRESERVIVIIIPLQGVLKMGFGRNIYNN